MRAVAVVGVLLQLGVLAWDAVVTYHLRWSKGNQKVPPYAFPMTVIGTLGLVCGMYLCAYIIEVSTKELKWQPGNDNAESDDKSPSSRIIWIQRHQTVGDQNFGSFAIYAPGSGKDTNLDLMTSHRSVNNKRKLHTLTLFAITSSIVGTYVGSYLANTSINMLPKENIY